MARIVTGLDIGSSTITAIIGKLAKDGMPEILGIAVEPAEGIRRGVVVDVEDATRAIRRSLLEASRVSGITIKSASVLIGGAYLTAVSSRGVVAVSRPDGEISAEDVQRAFDAAEKFIPTNVNRDILHTIPREFKIDDEVGIRDPVGMNGMRLEVDALILEVQTHLLKTLLRCVETAGVKRHNVVFSALAASEAVLTKKQKELGVMLVDIGGGTADFAVFEEGHIIHAGSVPFGGEKITRDIAVGFQVPVELAEKIKLSHGTAAPELAGKKEIIEMSEFIAEDPSFFTKRELAEIIKARLQDLFELLHRELKKINRVQLLPAGVVLVGGGARVPNIIEIAKREMRLPVSIGVPQNFPHLPFDEDSSVQLAGALGLLRWGLGEHRNFTTGIAEPISTVKRFLKLFLP